MVQSIRLRTDQKLISLLWIERSPRDRWYIMGLTKLALFLSLPVNKNGTKWNEHPEENAFFSSRLRFSPKFFFYFCLLIFAARSFAPTSTLSLRRPCLTEERQTGDADKGTNESRRRFYSVQKRNRNESLKHFSLAKPSISRICQWNEKQIRERVRFVQRSHIFQAFFSCFGTPFGKCRGKKFDKCSTFFIFTKSKPTNYLLRI